MEYPYEGWKNIRGTSDRDAPGGSWKKYWEDHSEEPWPDFCCIEGCWDEATDGAHMFCSSVDNKEWIIPTCHAHNMKAGEYKLKDSTPSILISANVSETE